MSWRGLYDTARADGGAAAGYYNDNVRVESDTGPVNVRIPIPGAELMDLKMWGEEEVLAGIEPYVDQAPRLLHFSADPQYQIHEYISGCVLNDVAPRGVAVPAHVIGDVVRLFRQLANVPLERLPALPPSWPEEANTVGFAHRLSDLTTWVYERFRDEYEPLFERLAIPAEPLRPIVALWNGLTPRPLSCVHADVHRKNIIISDGKSVFLDWELALWGDPAYDLAVHLHKMGYQATERDDVIRYWLREMPSDRITGWEPDLPAYLAHEQVKSAIVDTVRYAQIFVDPTRARESRRNLLIKLTTKLNNAYRRWRVNTSIDTGEVAAALTGWAATRRVDQSRGNGAPSKSTTE